MKKLQISLMGVLVIVLAAASAFTTKDDGGVLTYKWYANSTGISSPTPTQLNNSGIFLTNSDVNGVPQTQMTQQQLDNYKAAHCFTPTTPICVAVIKYSDGTPNELLFVLNKTFVE